MHRTRGERAAAASADINAVAGLLGHKLSFGRTFPPPDVTGSGCIAPHRKKKHVGTVISMTTTSLAAQRSVENCPRERRRLWRKGRKERKKRETETIHWLISRRGGEIAVRQKSAKNN
jgi:hypothetical protein